MILDKEMSVKAPANKRFELIVLIVGCFIFTSAFVFGSRTGGVDSSDGFSVENLEVTVQDYSRFQHSNPMHSRMPCLLCHKREDNSAAPKLSGHLPCSGCHTEQFADAGSQICTVCHTNPQSGATKRFPGLRSFNIKFDHAKHFRQTDCATCHNPSRRGVALSVPSGIGAHSTCFQCHGPRTEVGGRNIGSCGICHQPGRPTKNSDWAAAFSKNFNHSEHRSVGNLKCASCHTVRAGMPRGKQVSAPAPSMHFANSRTPSCAACHDNRRVFGGNDFRDCKRCHTEATFKF